MISVRSYKRAVLVVLAAGLLAACGDGQTVPVQAGDEDGPTAEQPDDRLGADEDAEGRDGQIDGDDGDDGVRDCRPGPATRPC